MLYLDFETRSACDLKVEGVYNYAQHGSTEVLCMSYAFDDGEVQTWLPGQPLPDLTGHRIMAHNAAFERLIFWYVLQVNIPLEFFYCTAAQSRANCAPGSLEDVGRFAGASMKKDHRGAQFNGRHIFEAATKGSNRGAHGTHNDDITHGFLLDKNNCSVGSRVARVCHRLLAKIRALQVGEYPSGSLIGGGQRARGFEIDEIFSFWKLTLVAGP